MRLRAAPLLVTAAAILLGVSGGQQADGADNLSVRIDFPMPPPRWAQLQRQLLDENLSACREFFQKYFDDRGYLRCVVRWGANDGPDDAPENFNRWPRNWASSAGTARIFGAWRSAPTASAWRRPAMMGPSSCGAGIPPAWDRARSPFASFLCVGGATRTVSGLVRTANAWSRGARSIRSRFGTPGRAKRFKPSADTPEMS